MNNPVMQRQMFMAIGMPSKAPEEGIVSGMESVEGYEDRTPDNIEIIANNLRGDIRSMDERYLELASMVGEAAFETPEEVLALMQVQLQQQTAPQGGPPGAPQQTAPQQGASTAPPAPSSQPGGIEALVASAAPPQPQQPPQGMPPGPGGAPVGIEGIMPSNFAKGGEIDAQEEIDLAVDKIKTRRVNEDLQNKIFLYRNGMISLNELAQYMPGISTYDIANMFGGTDSNPLGRKFEYQLIPPVFTPPTKEEEDLSGMDLDQLEKLGSGKGLSEQDFGPSRIPDVNNLGELGAFDHFQNPKPQHGLRDALRSYISVPNPGGIEGLVAPPTEQAPVMRQAGSPPTGERTRVPFNPIKAPSYAEAVQSYGRLAPTNVGGRGVYSQSILDLLKTEAPTSRAGNPIPFVDRSGRLYQPVGGTDPRMASRGAQFLPKSAYGPLPSQLMRMAGPLGYTAGAGYLATEALMASDRNAGELTGDSFGLEFGSSVADTPGYRYMPGLEPTAVPPPVDQKPSGLAEKIPVKPTQEPNRESDEVDKVQLGEGVVPPITEDVTVEERIGAGTDLRPPAPPEPKERGLKERAQERYGIYKDLLGDDKNMRQAQALFLLAEAALNVAGAKSKEKGARGIMDRLSTGLKGLPAGMAALGAEASREDKALRTAAISATEAEMAAEAKERGLTLREYLKRTGKVDKKDQEILSLAEGFARRFGGTPQDHLAMAKDWNNGLLEQNKDTGEIQDKATGKILMSRVSPVREVVRDGKRVIEENDQLVGYLDPTIPYTVTRSKTFSPATPKQRPEFIERISNNESLVQDIENFYRDTTKNFIGIMPSVQSGVTNLTLPFFGENPFSNVPLQQQRNAALQMNQRLREMAMAYRGRPSNWSEEQVNKYLVDPEAIFKDKSQFFAVLENFRQGAINEINQDRHRLFPNEVPLRQMARIPLGTKQDPIVITKSDPEKNIKSTAAYLGELGRVNPNREVYVRLLNGTTERVTPELLRALTGSQ